MEFGNVLLMIAFREASKQQGWGPPGCFKVINNCAYLKIRRQHIRITFFGAYKVVLLTTSSTFIYYAEAISHICVIQLAE